MAHSLSPSPAVVTSFSTRAKKTPLLCSGFQVQCVNQNAPDQPTSCTLSIDRRRMVMGGAVVVAINVVGGERNDASAAARRPPPPPPQEKKDPNMSALQAKVLASKKRKEAMKESIAKLREKGTPIEK